MTMKTCNKIKNYLYEYNFADERFCAIKRVLEMMSQEDSHFKELQLE